MRLVLGTADLRDDSLTGHLLDRFYAAGGRAVDVANVYGDGESQRAVGKWLARNRRDEVVLYGKGCHPPFCAPGLVGAEVARALSLLHVDRLDVFMLHRDEPSIPVSEFADALLDEVAAGRIGGFGVSNWTLPRFRELESYVSGARSGNALVAFSNHYSLGEMVTPTWPGCLSVTKEELAELVGSGVEILAWASLAMGYFAGRDAPHWQSAKNAERRGRAAQLAGELDTTAHAVALAYILHSPDAVRPIIGTRSEAHLDEALSAIRIHLDDAQVAWLEEG